MVFLLKLAKAIMVVLVLEFSSDVEDLFISQVLQLSRYNRHVNFTYIQIFFNCVMMLVLMKSLRLAIKTSFKLSLYVVIFNDK